MGSNLDWNVDESDREPPWRAARKPAQESPAPRPHWGRWILAGAVLIIAAGLGTNWILQRVEQTQGEQHDLIVGLAQTEERRAQDNDMEALGTLADELYPAWRQWQSQQRWPRVVPVTGALIYGIRWGDTPLNQYAAIGEPVYDNFQLDGEQATIDAIRQYGLGDFQFRLRVTEYYRYANGTWVHTEPPAEVWSTMVAVGNADLELLVPAHDLEALQPLIPRLQRLAARACAGLNCTLEPHMIISARVEDLLQQHPTGLANPRYSPAPALIGEATDDTGREALFRFYGIRLVRHIAESQAPGDEALAMEKLVDLGLEAP